MRPNLLCFLSKFFLHHCLGNSLGIALYHFLIGLTLFRHNFSGREFHNFVLDLLLIGIACFQVLDYFYLFVILFY